MKANLSNVTTYLKFLKTTCKFLDFIKKHTKRRQFPHAKPRHNTKRITWKPNQFVSELSVKFLWKCSWSWKMIMAQDIFFNLVIYRNCQHLNYVCHIHFSTILYKSNLPTESSFSPLLEHTFTYHNNSGLCYEQVSHVV